MAHATKLDQDSQMKIIEQLAESVPDGLSRIDGILRTNTVLAFQRFSAEDLEAAWDIGVS